MEVLARDFHERGYALVRRALEPAAVDSFVAQIAATLHSGAAGESGPAFAAVRLDDPSTWPVGKARRVAEVAPHGVGPHWDALAASPALSAALDAVLGGPGAWELPCNAVEGEGAAARLTTPRHFYAPVVFPEAQRNSGSGAGKRAKAAGKQGKVEQRDCVEGGSGDGERSNSDGSMTGAPAASSSSPSLPPPPCLPPRVCPFRPASELLPRAGETPPPPETSWVPVSRRRWAGLGWHLDVGPGFANNGERNSRGHPLQGAVVLLLLSDWGPGDGGTVMLPGSHRWVLSEILQRETRLQKAEGAAAGEAEGAASADGAPLQTPHTHESLNSWAVERLRCATEAGRVLLAGCRCGGYPRDDAPQRCCAFTEAVENSLEDELRRPLCAAGAHPLAPGATAPLWCEQIVGRAGDAVLMHPLTLHCGTTNASSPPRLRLMVNGMAVLKEAAFTAAGGAPPLLALLGAEPSPLPPPSA